MLESGGDGFKWILPAVGLSTAAITLWKQIRKYQDAGLLPDLHFL